MEVRRRMERIASPFPKPRKRARISKKDQLWLGSVSVSFDIARLGKLVTTLGHILRFKHITTLDLGRTAPPMIHYMVGDRRRLCINMQSERFRLDHRIDDQNNAAANIIKLSTRVLKEASYFRDLALARKSGSYNFVFDADHGLFAVAEPGLDHNMMAESFGVLKKLGIIDENAAYPFIKGEFKMRPEPNADEIYQVGIAPMSKDGGKTEDTEKLGSAMSILSDAVKLLPIGPDVNWYLLASRPS